MNRAEEAHQQAIEHQLNASRLTLGGQTSNSLLGDPKHLGFVLARYKFVAKMLDGQNMVLEIGCGDGIGMPVVAQAVQALKCTDWDERITDDLKARWGGHFANVNIETSNILDGEPVDTFDAVYAVDMIEHLDPPDESLFWTRITETLKPDGICLIGTPNKTAEHLAGLESRLGHINLHTHESLRVALQQNFRNVFMFGMNDEVVHTGYPAMAHYLWGMGVGVKTSSPEN
jgi:2-polyprenyl-3-methyl-5-hydroxy-6-metoxy-1,4-benzoquinol methylase